MRDMVTHIGFGTKVNEIDKKVTSRTAALALQDCDLIFGCTDDQYGRAIINQLCVRYLIPVVDMGVRIFSNNEGMIRTIPGRVTLLIPGRPCLFCRKRITPQGVSAEQMPEDLRRERVREGYAPELGQRDPSVVSLTTAIASLAVLEMLNLLTGFMELEEKKEFVWIFDARKIQKREEPEQEPDCFCGVPLILGRGDTREFLEMTWAPELESWN